MLSTRIIPCLDVHAGRVVKGVRFVDLIDAGDPVEQAKAYEKQGADELVFLDITASNEERKIMLDVVERTASECFMPLTVGGGIRDFTDSNGKHYSSLEVASAYFASGADKVSIGSDAVEVAERFYANNQQGDGTSSIETISNRYGSQAVVISIDPRRKYEADPKDTKNKCIETKRKLGPNGEKYCWFQCTIKGGREKDAISARTS